MNAPKPTLYYRPAPRVFQDLTVMRKALAESARFTQILDVGSKSQLRMAPDATVGGKGLRYTAQGLKQVLATAALGSFQTVSDLAGASPRPGRIDDGLNDLAGAVAVYNRVVDQRFPRFDGKVRLIVNIKSGLVEGVLGPRYELYENGDLVDRAADAVGQAERPCRFYSGVLVGRRMTVRFVHKKSLCEQFVGDAYHGGYHFSNSEVGGEATVRAATLVYRPLTDSFSMGPFLGGRVIHTGRDFGQKLARVFAAVGAAAQDPDALLRRLNALATRNLGFGAGVDRRRREAELAATAHAGSVPLGVALRAAEEAVFYGSAPRRPNEMPAPPGEKTRAARTYLDFYSALTIAARPLYATPRETVEQFAHRLLTGTPSR